MKTKQLTEYLALAGVPDGLQAHQQRMTWTPDADALLMRLRHEHQIKDLAAIFGCSKQVVSERIAKLRRAAVRQAGADLMRAWT